MENIKIVVWDLDDTFWAGTLSEGNVIPSERNIEIIKSLVDRGIMNTISSKNDYEIVKETLVQMGIWEYFIFPHINWEPKGKQIQDILEQCSLRAENALFIDDNLQNLNEAKYYNKEINIATPEILLGLLDLAELAGKPDEQNKRLKQYKILEEKADKKGEFSSNEEFLRDANIEVCIEDNCYEYFDRILDLINRSNQLNYTKKRLDEEGLNLLLKNEKCNCGYVTVRDKYGEYGIVGFFAIEEKKAEHFLFSCRTIGMGIEQYVYAKLNFPQVDVVGEVRSELQNNYIPDWINAGNNSEKQEKVNSRLGKKVNILLSGGCDLDQMVVYMNTKNANIDCKFNVGKVRHDHTVYYKGGIEYTDAIKQELIKNLPFVGSMTFTPYIYDEKYDVVIISLLMDYTQAIYQKKDAKNILIAYGDYNRQITRDNREENFTEEQHMYLMNNFECIGRETRFMFKQNLEYIRSHINSNIAVIFINGCEVPLEHPVEIDRFKGHYEFNQVLDEFIKENSENTYLLDMRKIVTTREQLSDNIRHYNREAYYRIACELSKMIQTITDVDAVEGKWTVSWCGKIKKKINRLKMRIKNKFV